MPKKATPADGVSETMPGATGFEDLRDEQTGQSEGQTAQDGSIAGSAKGMVNSAKEAASHAVDQVKDQAASRANQQRETIASGFDAVAHAFRHMGDGLREQDRGIIARCADELGEMAGSRIERLGRYLHGRDIRHIVNDTEDLAHRSPALFFGGAFVLGIVASRFLKSSRPAPDWLTNVPDPNRALPAGSTGDIQGGS